MNKTIIIFIALLALPIMAMAQGKITRPAKQATSKTASKQTPRRQQISSRTYTVRGVTFKMMKVESGTFTMGATSEMINPKSDEKPTHRVTLSGFYIGQTEVTQALWVAVMGNNPSKFVGDNHPVENVSWDDCQTFIYKLNNMTGKHFRLPTEAEWEFAARGGNNSNHTQYSGSSYIDDIAWYKGNNNSSPYPVARKQANELGIYDMTGNVSEWCSDLYGNYSSHAQSNPRGSKSGSSRVTRGGNYSTYANYCKLSARLALLQDMKFSFIGVRLCLSE